MKPTRKLSLSFFLLILSALISVVACSKKEEFDEAYLHKIGDDPTALTRYEQQHGKIGAHVLPAILVQASKYLDRPYEELVSLVKKDLDQAQTMVLGSSLTINEGPFVLLATDSVGGNPMLFGSVKFKNTSGTRSVLLTEAINAAGISQGFFYRELEPGGTFLFKNNDPTKTIAGNLIIAVPRAGATAVVFGTADGFDFATAALESAFSSERNCTIVRARVLRNQCIGNCQGLDCKATETKSFWVFGTEPKDCGCQ